MASAAGAGEFHGDRTVVTRTVSRPRRSVPGLRYGSWVAVHGTETSPWSPRLSLPEAEQRTLERMAEALLSSEPRLVSMFAIFTRLTQNETWPRWEQLLPATPAWLLWLTTIAQRLPGGQTARGRRRWSQIMVLTNVAIAVGLLLALTGLYLHGSPACIAVPAHSALFATARQSCPLSGAK
jgi:hypothetical protein